MSRQLNNPRGPFLRAPMAVFLLGSFFFLYLLTFILPRTPIYQGDNAPVFLMEALRMLHGQVIYRDFFELTFPGTQVLYLLLFKTVGVHAWIPAVLLAMEGLGLGYCCVFISRRFFSGAAIYLPGILFLTLGFAHALDATHHWLSIVAVIAATGLLIEKRTFLRTVGAGVLCGLAACFTQSRGLVAVAAFAFFLLWEWRKRKERARWLFHRVAGLVAGFVAVLFPVIVFSIRAAGWKMLYYCTFTYILRYYSSFSRNNLGVYMVDIPQFSMPLEIPAVAIWLFVHLLIPLVYLIFFVRYAQTRRRHPEERWDRLMLVNTAGLALFLAIASAPNWFKISSATLPALILLVWFLQSPGRFNQVARTVLWVLALALAAIEPALAQLGWHKSLETPAGRVALTDEIGYEKFRWVREHTWPGDYFFEAGDSDLYFSLGLQDPSEVPFLTPTNYTRPWQVENAIEGLKDHRVRFVLWSPWLDLPNQKNGDHLGPLREYLRRNYAAAKTFDDGDQVWELRRVFAAGLHPSNPADWRIKPEPNGDGRYFHPRGARRQ